MCEGSFLPSSFGPHQKHTEFESSLRSYPISPSFAWAGFLRRSARSVGGRINMEPLGNQQVLHHRGNYLVRRQRLAPEEATPWHRDPFHRLTVVLSGDLLKIEFRDDGETQAWKIIVGEV